MAKLGIFTGTSPNDTTGDTLSQGAVKINSNFSEIYSAIGDGTNITNSLSTITVAGLSTFTNGPVIIGSGIQTGTSKLQVTGDTFITGSVGIGTTNPTSTLHVVGGGRFSGVVTALSFSGNSSSASYATTAGIATYATNAGISTSVIGGISSITQLQVTGISTFTNGPVLVGRATTTGTANQALQVESGAYFNGSVGIGTTNPGNAFNFSGITSTTTKFDVRGKTLLYYDSNVGYAVTKGDMDTYAVLKLRGHATDSTNMQFAHMNLGTAMGIQVTNYANNANWDLLLNPFGGQIAIGTTIFTGTVNQPLQVTGGAYVSGNLGIGTTNPTSSLFVNGSTVIGTEILDMTSLSSTFTTVGSNTFTVPVGVTKISAVLIGGGGAGGGSGGGSGGNGGGGGGLIYVNDFPVTPGQTLTVNVGAGGGGVSGGTGGNGENSSITGIATAFGGTGGTADYQQLVGAGGAGTGGSGGATGGSGGQATLTTGAGGGGAAGYSGNGGTGGNAGVTNGGVAGSGGGAGGGGSPTASGSGGGGVGILGQGTSGSLSNGAGNAGSGGSNGSLGNTSNGAAGGLYGGGGGGADGDTGTSQIGGNGAQGVVRIIFSPQSKFSRLFPTTQVGNNINQ